MPLRSNFLLFSTIFCYLLLDFHVKTGTRFSFRDTRLCEISEVAITRVDCIFYSILFSEVVWLVERKRKVKQSFPMHKMAEIHRAAYSLNNPLAVTYMYPQTLLFRSGVAIFVAGSDCKQTILKLSFGTPRWRSLQMKCVFVT